MADNTDKGSQGTKTLDEQINDALATADDKGQLTFEENVDPMFKKLVLTEKKSRQHQAKSTKLIQENTSLEATNQVLGNSINESAQLSAEQVAELDELKITDLDEWFSKKTQYENEAKQLGAGKMKELTDAASEKALNDLTLSERKDALAEFQERTGLELTDDVMENDIPPRLQNQIGTMPFDDYLDKVAEYLGKDKKVKPTDDSLDATNLGKLAGGEGNKTEESKGYQIL